MEMDEVYKLQKEFDEFKKNKAKEDNLEKLIKSEGLDKYPKELIKALITDDESESKKNIELLKGIGKTSYKNLEPTTNNPWSKEHFNLTKQAQILKENPELAVQLKSEMK